MPQLFVLAKLLRTVRAGALPGPREPVEGSPGEEASAEIEILDSSGDAILDRAGDNVIARAA
jgi:hypothetical protein